MVIIGVRHWRHCCRVGLRHAARNHNTIRCHFGERLFDTPAWRRIQFGERQAIRTAVLLGNTDGGRFTKEREPQHGVTGTI